jgi:hypothetical protein
MSKSKLQGFLINLFLVSIIGSSSLILYESYGTLARPSGLAVVESIAHENIPLRPFSAGRTRLTFSQTPITYFLHGDYESKIGVGEKLEFSSCRFFRALCFLKSNNLTYRPVGIVYLLVFLAGLISLIYSRQSVSFVFLTALIYVFLLFRNISVLSFLILKI